MKIPPASPFPLEWEVVYEASDKDHPEIISSPHTRRHHVYVPADAEVSEIEMYHEYAHAYLCETVHPLLSGSAFERGTDYEAMVRLTPVLRAANDWFTDELLYSRWPDQERIEVEKTIESLTKTTITTIELGTALALFLAQAERYDAKVRPHTLDKTLERLKAAFLSVDPSRPSKGALKRLVNRLIDALGLPYRVRIVMDVDEEVWRIERK